MAGAQVTVEGARQLRATLRRAGRDMQDLKDAHAQVSTYVANAAKGRTPRVTGTLAGSIRGNRAATSAVIKAGGPGSHTPGPSTGGGRDAISPPSHS